MDKTIENEVNLVLKEISEGSISEFKFENGKGMVVNFSHGDQFSELIFGAAELKFEGRKEIIENEEELTNSELKKNFVMGTIINAQLQQGDLVFNFNQGNNIRFLHSQKIENWEIRWKGRLTIVSMPGGEIAVF